MIEYLDIVDNNDKVIWKNTRKDSYKNATTNRIIAVLIFNDEWKLLLQQRSVNCSFMPLAWAVSAWWHVSSWETYLEAAKKELFEELWIKIELKFVWKYFDDRKQVNWKHFKWKKSHFYFESVYEWFYDGKFNFNDGEVEKVKFFGLEEIKDMIKKDNYIMPWVKNVLEKYYFNK